MRKFSLFLSLLMLITVLGFGQTRMVTGRVADAQGNPIPFATITVKGSTSGVSADQNGNFSIQANPNAILAVTAAGYQGVEINSGNQEVLNLVLGTQESLNEVVVTALGVRRTRNQVPFAAQQVTGEEISKNRSSNFAGNLSGRVSGLEIRQANTLGGSMNVVLRGVKSMTGNNQALFVVDGNPINNSNTKSTNQSTGRGGYDYGSTINDLNPDDIESVTVLKGAASTALYGSRGGNGVILITTKKAGKGLGITINSGISAGRYDKSTFVKYQNEYGAGYGEYYEDPTARFLYRDINGDGVDDLVTPLSEDASFGAKFDPNLMVYQWDAFDPKSPYFGKPRPWMAAAHGPASILQTAISSNQSILVDGGSDKGSFKLGYTRTDDRGILPNSKIAKNILNFGGTYNISSKLTAGASVNFTNTQGRGRYGTGYDDKNIMTNFRQWFQTNVDLQEQKAAYFREKKNVTWNWADPTDLKPIYWDNPYFSRYENFETDERNRMIGNVHLTYQANEWLNIIGRVTDDSYDEIQEERQAVGSVTTSAYSRNNRNFRESNYSLMVNIDKDISTDLNFKALIGTNLQKVREQSIYASSNGGLIVEKIYALSNSANPINAPIEYDARTEVWGSFAGATFSLKDMLTLDGNIRVDKTSTLPKNNNTYAYYSGSLGFVFSKLLQQAAWLSYGKLRLNYSFVGNATTPFRTIDVYNIGTPFGSSALVSVSGTAANPNLVPENTKSFETGVELSFLKNRLGFDVTYYDAKTFNQIYPVPVSTSTGVTAKVLNAGNIRNKGIELSVNGTPIQTSNFSWNINLNWTRNRNKVEELAEGIDNIVLGSFQGGVTLNATLGQPYGTIRGTDFEYKDGKRIINQANGRPVRTTSSNIVIGNANPDWIGGINNTLRYKNVSLSWLVDVRQGGDLFSLDLYYGLATGLYPETAGLNELGKPKRDPVANGGGVLLSGVDPDGKPNAVRAENVNFGLFGYARQPNKAFIYDASYVKLREVVLTYSLPKNIMNRLHSFKGIDLSLIGRNLWIIDKKLPYADPEEIISAGNLQGYQSGAYPTTRMLTFNVRLRF